MGISTNKTEVKEFLRFIGLTGYEIKAYLTLLTLGEATAPELSSKTGIPISRVYDVLESLVSRGLAEVKVGRPRIYRAVPPEIGINYYVRKYIDKILEMNKVVIGELSRMYSSVKRKGPFIWISSSAEMSIERAKEIINEASMDGFMSLSEDLFNKLVNTIYRKLLSDESVIFGLVLLFRPTGSKAFEQLLDLDNVDVRILPTGIIKAIETDFSRAAIFGKTYTLFTSEWELILLLNEMYYHGYWKIAKRIKNFEVKRGVKYRTQHHWLSLVLINDGLRSGYNAWVKVRGYRVKSREPIELEGFIKETKADDMIRNFIIETKEYGLLAVGGIGTSVEDIEARYIEVTFQ